MIVSRFKSSGSFGSFITWMFMLSIIFWLSKKSKPKLVHFEDYSTSTNISTASELGRIPDGLCSLWTSTRDNILRKSNYPCKHRYGLEFQVKHKNLHFLLCIPLAGDVAINQAQYLTYKQRTVLRYYI
jgi:hypothetical protein